MTSKPRPTLRLGMSLGVTRLLPRWGPAYRQHDPDLGSCSERTKAYPILPLGVPGARGRASSGGIREELSTDAWCAGGLARSSCDPPACRSGWGSEGAGSSGLMSVINQFVGGVA